MIGRKPIGRRDALKMLAASAGAVLGAAALPAKWMKPVVETGVLPVHAQSSNTITISYYASIYVEGPGMGIAFEYVDALGGFDPGWTLHYQIEGFAWRTFAMDTGEEGTDYWWEPYTPNTGLYATPADMPADLIEVPTNVSFYTSGEGRTSNTVTFVLDPSGEGTGAPTDKIWGKKEK
jgi:hypothetical protein